MKLLVMIYLLLLLPNAACSIGPKPISTIIENPFKYEKEEVTVRGYLCVDLSTVYISTVSTCDDFSSGRQVVLVVNENMFRSLEGMKNGSKISLTGVFKAPPRDAIVMPQGILVGSHIKVSRIISERNLD